MPWFHPAGTADGVYRSTDRGQNFRHADFPDRGVQVWSFLQDDADPKWMLAGGSPVSIYRSEDDGASWKRMPDPQLPMHLGTLRKPVATELTMLERNNSVPLSLFVQAERLARVERGFVIKACVRGTMRRFAEWLRVLGVLSIRLARDLAANESCAAPSASSISSTIVCWQTSASREVRSNLQCATECPHGRPAISVNTLLRRMHDKAMPH